MAASRLLQRAWACLPATQQVQLLKCARASVDGFADATQQHGSLLQSWIRGREVRAFAHYPEGDVIDLRHGAQFYYHAHRDGSVEHGHLHLFWHATASGRRSRPRLGRPRWVRTAPTHLLAISLDARGLPVGLFTVNQWVTEGHWFDASTTLGMLDRFRVDGLDGHEASCRWLAGFLKLYHPLIAELLTRRDKRLERQADPVAARRTHALEVLSASRIDWAADLDELERIAAAARRP